MHDDNDIHSGTWLYPSFLLSAKVSLLILSSSIEVVDYLISDHTIHRVFLIFVAHNSL
ncbi:hypothetical protein VCCP104821_1382 [Vibrio cholerae CP1048(21)]|nr:hypothetical protein VCHC06A1_1728 [Vibrio cholerae HC-06A1]EHI06352.1 hypothetical protein VCHC61A1_2263 [Vibrio cholerae HC-61A1]EJH34753.1 hypothetical protein VCCP103811_2235 [Vibrio cholerae CP1038(11)]EJH47794.1 hypothetical protein VCCP104821_1382 [Vibrio cholerae CP1048(21)]ELT25801.1 hypothetical protein VCHC7A1_02466 [Vibrio cholerae HC-7A1]EMQ17582.1 hypothetical protein VCEC0051_001387 [Vibrio cholerae O1 str. EC-0051]EMQ48268.1 hypothetical protein VCPCS023_001648 [Vibrio chol